MVIPMKWEDIRKLYPNRFVKLKILKWRMDGSRKYRDYYFNGCCG